MGILSARREERTVGGEDREGRLGCEGWGGGVGGRSGKIE